MSVSAVLLPRYKPSSPNLTSLFYVHDKRNERSLHINEKLINQAKHNATIKKFHLAFSYVTGKKFRIESESENHLERQYYSKFVNMELVIFLISLVSIINSVAYYEMSYDNGLDTANHAYVILLYSSMVLTIMLYIALVLNEKLEVKHDIDMKIASSSEGLFSSGRYKKLILYFLLIFVHPNPIFEEKYYTNFNLQVEMSASRSINSILCIFVLLRCYFLIRPLLVLSAFMDPDTKNICQSFNFDANLLFTLKCKAKQSSFQVYFLGMLLLVFSFSFAMRIFERPISEKSYDYNNFFQALWCLLITMTTVGYGDKTARTNEGRVIVMIACIFGVFLISMMIVAITGIFSMDMAELNVFLILNRSEALEETEVRAKKVILNFSRIIKKFTIENKEKWKYHKIVAREPKAVKPLKKSIGKLNEMLNRGDEFNTNEFFLLNSKLSFFSGLQTSLNERRNLLKEKVENMKQRMRRVLEMLNEGR